MTFLHCQIDSFLGILIKFKGQANVQWIIEESKTNNEGKTENERIELAGDEEYFKIQYYCLGGKDGKVNFDLIKIEPPLHS